MTKTISRRQQIIVAYPKRKKHCRAINFSFELGCAWSFFPWCFSETTRVDASSSLLIFFWLACIYLFKPKNGRLIRQYPVASLGTYSSAVFVLMMFKNKIYVDRSWNFKSFLIAITQTSTSIFYFVRSNNSLSLQPNENELTPVESNENENRKMTRIQTPTLSTHCQLSTTSTPMRSRKI